VTTPDDADALPAARAQQASTHGPEGDALVVEVRASLETLTRLLEHEQRLGSAIATSIRSAVADAEARLLRDALRVVVVGEPGSGKSTLLDALIGERVLGKSKVLVPVTLRSASQRDYRARFAGGALDHFGKKFPDRGGATRKELAEVEIGIGEAHRHQPDTLRELTAAGGAFEVAEDALGEISQELEKIAEDAERASRERASRDGAHSQLRSEAERAELALPAPFRERPAWWAIWHWALWMLVWPFLRRRLRQRRLLLGVVDQSEQELSNAQAASEAAALRRRELELDRSEAEVPFEQAKARLDVARERAAEHEARTSDLVRRRQRLQNELVRLDDERRGRFAADLGVLLDGSPARRLVELEVDYPARVLPRDIAMIDAPGAFSNDAAAEQRFWAFLEKEADACLVVSEVDRAVSGKTRGVLQRLRSSVVHAILVLTKLDQAVRTALRQGSRELSGTVEQARRIATRRFAREVGRDPDTVLSVAVAAEDALEHPETYESFEREAGKLFQLLRQERALILGSHCALVVRRCIAAAAETERRAEQTYVERIGTLEAKRRPAPADLRLELVRAAEPELDRIAGGAVTAAGRAVDDNVLLIRAACESSIFGCANDAELGSLGPRLTAAIHTGFERARDELSGIVSKHAEQALDGVEKNAYAIARQRYDLLPVITRSPGSALRIELVLDPPALSDQPDRRIAQALRFVRRLRIALLAGGAALGLVVGTIVMPGIGGVVGALLGSLANFGVTLGVRKKRCRAAIGDLIMDTRHSLSLGVLASRQTITTSMSVFLDELIDRALSRFGRWIAEPLEAERLAIQAERDKLEDLQRLIVALEEHDRALEALSQAATRASLGLCR
jgi:GTP-binding protein EngB required for normal cell division